MQILEIHDVAGVTDDSVIEIIRCCPKIRTLNVALCPKITDRAVDFIARRARNIRSLYLASCDITNEGE